MSPPLSRVAEVYWRLGHAIFVLGDRLTGTLQEGGRRMTRPPRYHSLEAGCWLPCCVDGATAVQLIINSPAPQDGQGSHTGARCLPGGGRTGHTARKGRKYK